jgi:hypothetical protein
MMADPRVWPYGADQYDPLMLQADLALEVPPPRLSLEDRPTPGASWEAFAYWEKNLLGGWYSIVGPRHYVQLYAFGAPIVPVTVTEVTAGDPDATHWGWINAGAGIPEWALVWPTRPQYRVCFPYGVEAEEEAGRGRTVRLRVTAKDVSGNSPPPCSSA